MTDTASSQRWSFTEQTAPFFDVAHREPARFVLRQVGDDHFTVEETIVYDDGTDEVVVSADTLVETDLASIPFFMAWFVPVNGRHTPAALVHDTLLADIGTGLAGGGLSRSDADRLRGRADRVFLRAMAASGVPLLRRGLMYAAVTMATRWTRSAASRAALALWVVASLAGSVVLVVSLATGRWWLTAAALVAPIPAALLWGARGWRPGVLAGYGAWLIGLPALATAGGYAAYWLAEQAVRPLSRSDGSPPGPPPAPYR